MIDPSKRSRAIVLLSGGLDSATVLAIAQEQQFDVTALSFRYGQRHANETECAKSIASKARVTKHVLVDVDLQSVGGSALTDSTFIVPKHENAHQIGNSIPITYVPARNTLFLSYALAWAEAIGARDIFIGVNALDYSGYPDCRPEFIEAFEKLANLATKVGVDAIADPSKLSIKIHAPLIAMTKAEIIALGTRLGVDYASTSSCYDPLENGVACGFCDSCLLRKAGFAANQQVDPIRYAE